MMYIIELTDSNGVAEMPVLEVPLTETVIEGAVDVVTLDNNMYTDFINQKRMWNHRWATLTEAEFNTLKGYYDRQFSNYEYPTLTISELGVTDVPVRMTLSPQSIVDNCGTVSGVEVSFRESVDQQGSS